MDEHRAMRLDQFLKLRGIIGSGGQAKHLIQAGEILVNGEVVTQRRRKLSEGDRVHFDGDDYRFTKSALDKPEEES